VQQHDVSQQHLIDGRASEISMVVARTTCWNFLACLFLVK